MTWNEILPILRHFWNRRFGEGKYLHNSCTISYQLHRRTKLIKENKLKEEFEDTKGVIRIREWKKNRQHNDQTKRYKGQTTVYKTYT